MTQCERTLMQGILSKNAAYKIIVIGDVGPKEIETLIRKLEIDKEILADESAAEPAVEPHEMAT